MGTEVIHWLITDPNGTYADFTVGGGGHSLLIWSKLRETGRLCGIDRDPEAIAEARRRLPTRNELWNIQFSETASKLSEWSEQGFSGILLDLGISSHQIDEAGRGFSYRFDGPLDLRMSPAAGESAADLLARLSEAELKTLLRELGEDSQAGRIARAIAHARTAQPIRTTAELASIVRRSVPATAHKSLPRVFQALRMAVNHELAELDAGLAAAWRLLKCSGRLVVLTYHSLEDRPTKQFMQGKVYPPAPALFPYVAPAPRALGRYPVRGPILPSADEIARNPRARSAKLRVLEKIHDD
ncbi:MAG: 16S rRNA (cytosine(1402)-N(4))-methyltransferase RsmH [bacterium]|nr:16S rRNA (cytosine(1402)-N(4))-methyltransferase RsmH [bacterium]